MMSRHLNYIIAVAFIGLNALLLLGSAEYFSKSPNDLSYVLAIALAGGLFATLYSKLGSTHRYTVKLVFWGAFAVCSSLTLAAYLVNFVQLLSILKPTYSSTATSIVAILIGFLAVIIVTAYSAWREFVQFMKGRLKAH